MFGWRIGLAATVALLMAAAQLWSGARAQPIDKTGGTDPALTAVTQAAPSPAVATLPPTQAIDATPAVHLFGDWDGLQPRLLDDGINIQLDALTEFAQHQRRYSPGFHLRQPDRAAERHKLGASGRHHWPVDACRDGQPIRQQRQPFVW